MIAIGVDQVIKLLCRAPRRRANLFSAVRPFFELRHVTNTGAAFSLWLPGKAGDCRSFCPRADAPCCASIWRVKRSLSRRHARLLISGLIGGGTGQSGLIESCSAA
ncbi:MAG: signal peptidase II [Christensenellales bacterium]